MLTREEFRLLLNDFGCWRERAAESDTYETSSSAASKYFNRAAEVERKLIEAYGEALRACKL